MNKDDTAPIFVSTYSRPEHLRRTLDALAANRLAEWSDVYVFSDGPRPGDEEKVQAVRDYVDTVSDGFRSVTVIKREVNNRVANNRGGIVQLLEASGQVICLEEDVVTAPDFLEFMNQGLNVYRDRNDIFAICGYTPPIIFPDDYSRDIFRCPRFNAWGFATWKDRYDSVIFDKSQYKALLSNPEKLRQYKRRGEDVEVKLRSEAEGRLDALDVKIIFTQFINQQSVISPVQSLVLNIGHDGTGLHCRSSNRFDVGLSEFGQTFEMDPDIESDSRIDFALYCFRSQLSTSLLPRVMVRDLWRPFRRFLGKHLKGIRS
ncbi:MAG: hypothetical protein AAF456_00180 [Planctomycetota bacterium]